MFNTFQIMQTSILQQKLAKRPPDIYIAPEITDVRVLEFFKADLIFRQAEPAKDLLRRKIEGLLESV